MKEKMLQKMAEHIAYLIKFKSLYPQGEIAATWSVLKFVIAPSLGMTWEEARKIVADKIQVINSK